MTEATNCSIVNDIIVIMDESGSMGQLGDEPNQALNSFLVEQKSALSDDATFTLWGFNHEISLKIDDVPLKELDAITNIVPNGMTALFDAIGNAINTKLGKTRKDNVICVVITDGEENSSKEFKKDEIQKLIKLAEEKHQWKFVYLGANQDAFAVGENMGVYRNCCVQFEANHGELLRATRAVSENIAVYRNASSQGIHESDFALGATEPQSLHPPLVLRQPHNPPNLHLVTTPSMLTRQKPALHKKQSR